LRNNAIYYYNKKIYQKQTAITSSFSLCIIFYASRVRPNVLWAEGMDFKAGWHNISTSAEISKVVIPENPGVDKN
jgi:hypothetical protein